MAHFVLIENLITKINSPSSWASITRENSMKKKFFKTAYAAAALSVCSFANAGLIEVDFEGGTGGALVGNTYETSGLTFDNAYYSNCYGSGWIAGENDTCYNSNYNKSISGSFLGTTDFLSAILKYPDNGVTSLLEVYDINNNLLASTSVNAGNSLISLNQVGISSFRFSWSNDDVVGLESISFNGVAAATIPEPSTIAIFALGLLGLASRKIKKQ